MDALLRDEPVTDSLDTLLETAVEGARRAGRVLAERFHQPRTIAFKGGIDLVTDADKASETVLLAWLRERHPDHAILSEESGASAGSRYRWIIDPLDGTTNYAHQLPHFSVSIAVEGEGGVQVGVVYDPMRDELFTAVRGRGATLNGTADPAERHRPARPRAPLHRLPLRRARAPRGTGGPHRAVPGRGRRASGGSAAPRWTCPTSPPAGTTATSSST